MSLPLTVQQRAQRCRCGRYLAWRTTQHAVCCGWMQPSVGCPCEPTEDPAAGCHRLDLQRVAEPEGQDPACE